MGIREGNPEAVVLELMYGRWRTQTMVAGLALVAVLVLELDVGRLQGFERLLQVGVLLAQAAQLHRRFDWRAGVALLAEAHVLARAAGRVSGKLLVATLGDPRPGRGRGPAARGASGSNLAR